MLMSKRLLGATAVAVFLAGCATTPSPDDAPRRFEYLCEGGAAISAIYLLSPSGETTFVVLGWRDREYGLAPAVSASGARYAGLYGPSVSDHGLEWWEAKGEATLSAFTGEDRTDTRPLLTGCRPRE